MGLSWSKPERILNLSAVTLVCSWAILLFCGNDWTQAQELQSNELPKGWQTSQTINVQSGQLRQFSKNLGGEIVAANNRILNLYRNKSVCKLNTIRCASEKDAKLVYANLLKLKKDIATVARKGDTVFELVVTDSRFSLYAKSQLGFIPEKVTYEVKFQAAPIKSGDYGQANKSFNAFLNLSRGAGIEAAKREIEKSKLASRFSQVGNFRSYGMGNSKSDYDFRQERTNVTKTELGVSSFEFENHGENEGIRVFDVTAKITSQSFALTPALGVNRKSFLGANEFWPSENAQIQKLARSITKNSKTDKAKVEAIWQWFRNRSNIRFGGAQVGSRLGTLKVLKQKAGHCWDYSDLFITLCRANDLPCRQVGGWLCGSEGHVWAEILIEDQWMAIDPTSDLKCSSNYVPYISSHDGEWPFLYTSSISLNPVKVSQRPIERDK